MSEGKLLPIPACQQVVTTERLGPGVVATRAHLCAALSVAVIRYDDGQERFVCAEHAPDSAPRAAAWELHRREVAAKPMPAGPVPRELLGRWAGRGRRPNTKPPETRRQLSPEARQKIAAAQRAQWARYHEAKAAEAGAAA